jgi:release factor glutamine methyltransferase
MTSTIQDALQDAQSRLKATSKTPRLDAQVLLAHVLNKPKAYLLAYPEQTLTGAQQTQYNTLITRRADDEPVAYLVGEKGFWDVELLVSSDVLVPRPETEHLIEAALAWAHQTNPALTIADIGTGSGAIAVTMAHHLPQATVYATDISPAALSIARKNSARYQTDVRFYQGSLAQPLIDAGVRVTLLLANLPYIPADDVPRLTVSRHEPALALDGGADGLDLVRDLIQQVPQVCAEGALILLEVGSGQGQAVIEYAQAHLATQATEIIDDYAGHDRIVKIQLAAI